MKLTDYLLTITKDIDDKILYRNNLRELVLVFPDIEIVKDRQNDIFVSSSATITEFEFAYHCECCIDCDFYFKPYTMFYNFKIYGKPHKISIGWKNIYPDKKPIDIREDWRELLKNYPTDMIQKVAEYVEEKGNIITAPEPPDIWDLY